MNFSNSMLYKSIYHLEPSALAIAKARLNDLETKTTVKTTVIENQTIDDVIVKEMKAPNSKNVSSNIFSQDYFNLTNDNSDSHSAIKDDEIFVEENEGSKKINSKEGIITVLYEGTGKTVGEIGLASINVSSPILYLSQFSDDLFYTALITKLQLHTPTELLVPKSVFESNCKSIGIIKKVFFDIKITPLPRRHFNEEEGCKLLLNLASIESKNDFKTYDKQFYAIRAAAALIKYIRTFHNISFYENSLNIKYHAKYARMFLDCKTCDRLELIIPVFQSKENKATLFNVLDKTVTNFGKKRIKSKILEPYLEEKDILFVQEAIKELLEHSKNKNIVGDISNILKKFYNVENILKLSVNERTLSDPVKSVQIMLNKIILLKSTIEVIPELCCALKNFKSFNLYKAYTNLMDNRYNKMVNIIDEVIRPESQFIRGSGQYFQRIHAVRPGLNKYLDLLREMYNNLTDGINEDINQLAANYGLPLRMTYTMTKGFHIQLKKSKKNTDQLQLPSELILLYQKVNASFFTTNEIIKYNIKLKETANEIYICSEKIIHNLVEDLSQYSEANCLLVDIIANLDVIVSFAKVSQTDGFCCPNFGLETRIVDARHIFLEKAMSGKPCVPNNIIATPEYNVFIITGPNMAGKTVYLKTIALIQIIAQLGCFVPATSAKIRICDKIFTRLGFEENIEDDVSAFDKEMDEMKYILRNLTPRSLVIIDEIFRTTHPEFGFNFAWKMCSKLCQFEQIVEKDEKVVETENVTEKSNNYQEIFIDHNDEVILNLPMPHIYISTHFLGLTKLKEKFFNVINLQVEAEEVVSGDTLSLKFTHKVKEGVTTIKNYALKLAELVGMPEEIIKDAYSILNDILMDSKENEENFVHNFSESIEEIGILHKTLDTLFPNKTFEFKQQRDSSIANFMNHSDKNYMKKNEYQKSVLSSSELMNLFCYKMYDFYADIIALKRRTPPYSKTEFTEKANEIFESIKDSLPQELQELLASKDVSSILKEFKNDSHTNTDQNIEFGLKESHQVGEEKTPAVLNEKIIASTSITVHPEPINIVEQNPNKNEDTIKENIESARVIENIQIVPPHKIVSNMNFFEEVNSLNFINLKDFGKQSFPSTSNYLNKSFDFDLFNDFKIDYTKREENEKIQQKDEKRTSKLNKIGNPNNEKNETI